MTEICENFNCKHSKKGIECPEKDCKCKPNNSPDDLPRKTGDIGKNQPEGTPEKTQKAGLKPSSSGVSTLSDKRKELLKRIAEEFSAFKCSDCKFTAPQKAKHVLSLIEKQDKEFIKELMKYKRKIKKYKLDGRAKTFVGYRETIEIPLEDFKELAGKK